MTDEPPKVLMVVDEQLLRSAIQSRAPTLELSHECEKAGYGRLTGGGHGTPSWDWDYDFLNSLDLENLWSLWLWVKK